MIKEEKKLNPLFFIIVIDLVLGGSGRIFTFGPLTLRYILFFIAILYFFIMVIMKNIVIKRNIFYRPIIVFLLFLLISIANGVIRGYPISNVLSSFQGYLYILLIFPFLFTINTVEQAKYLMEILYKATLLLALFSIILFVSLTIFPFQTYDLINPVLLKYEYGHLDINVGMSRVFFKTSPYMAAACIYGFFKYINFPSKRNITLILSVLVLLIGCITTKTMGIWIAVIFGIIVVILLSKGVKKFLTVFAVLLLSIVLFGIFPEQLYNTISSRFSSTDSSLIIKSDQFWVLLNTWLENPILGKGFGITIDFNVMEIKRTMIRFELFWLEILVNMGIVGFLSYVYIIVKTIFVGYQTAKKLNNEDSTNVKSFIIGLMMFCVISSVNPFLNNPIGIGYLIITMTIVSNLTLNLSYYRSIHKINSIIKETYESKKCS